MSEPSASDHSQTSPFSLVVPGKISPNIAVSNVSEHSDLSSILHQVPQAITLKQESHVTGHDIGTLLASTASLAASSQTLLPATTPISFTYLVPASLLKLHEGPSQPNVTSLAVLCSTGANTSQYENSNSPFQATPIYTHLSGGLKFDSSLSPSSLSASKFIPHPGITFLLNHNMDSVHVSPSISTPSSLGTPTSSLMTQAPTVKIIPSFQSSAPPALSSSSPIHSHQHTHAHPHSHKHKPHAHRAGRHCKPKEDRRCGVCGDKALSCNFDALCCESCKAFFRRNASKDTSRLKCPYQDNCQISVTTRRLCTVCRLRRCFEIGMKKEYILTMEERSEKKKKITQNKILKKLEEREWIFKDLSMAELAEKNILTDQEIHEIDEITNAYDASLRVKMEERSGQKEAPGLIDLVNFAEISIRRAIEMFKHIKSFNELDKPTQMILLKSGCVELLVLRGVLSFDSQKQRFLDSVDSENADAMSMQDFMLGAGGEAGQAFQQFTTSLRQRVGTCRVTILLLLIVCLFSERSECVLSGGPVGEIDDDMQTRIEDSQYHYSRLLRKFLSTKWTIVKADRLFPQLIMLLSDLRTINKYFSRRMLNINLVSATPLMTELLDFSSRNTAAPTVLSTTVGEPNAISRTNSMQEHCSICRQSSMEEEKDECCAECHSCDSETELEVDSPSPPSIEKHTICSPIEGDAVSEWKVIKEEDVQETDEVGNEPPQSVTPTDIICPKEEPVASPPPTKKRRRRKTFRK